MLEIVLDFVRDNSPKLYEKVKFKIDDIDLVYSHTLPSNDIDMANMIVNLNNQKLLAPRIALQGLSFIPNVDDYLKEVKEWNEYIDTRKIMLENEIKDNGGVNSTNIERQNSKLLTRNQEKNLVNETIGESQNITE